MIGDLGKTYIKYVKEVSVFYWSYLELLHRYRSQRGRPLLVKVTLNDGYPKYYENVSTLSDDNTEWKEWKKFTTVTPEDLQSKLRLLNCKLNNAVIVDLNQQGIPDYYDTCKDKTFYDQHGNRMQVRKEDIVSLQKYNTYTHTLKDTLSGNGMFHIVSFKNGTNPINIGGIPDKPILDVREVRVYTCGYVPLLLYYEKDIGGGNFHCEWYKNASGKAPGHWTSVPDLSNTDDPNEYDKILTELDTLTSSCKPPLVTIDIFQKDTVRGYESPDSTRPNEQIKVEKKDSQGTSGDPLVNYELYEHTVKSRPNSYFTLEKLVYGAHSITLNGSQGATLMENVTSVSVYYWKYLSNGRPLLLKIEQAQHKSNPTGEKTLTWYENEGEGGNLKWREWKQSSLEYYLKTKLDLLNCKLNNVVKINVDMKPDNDTPGNHKGYDSCSTDPQTSALDPSHGERLKVTNKTPLDNNELTTYKAYEHTLAKSSGNGGKFHIVGFTGGSSITTLDGKGTEDNPILDIQTFTIYVCNQNLATPLLIYYTTDGHNKWFKDSVGSGGWTKAELDNKPEDYYKILDELNNIDKTRNPCKPPETGTSAALAGVGTAAVGGALGSWAIFGASSAPIAGAGGITGFGWWIFKRTRGDPWVRQI